MDKKGFSLGWTTVVIILIALAFFVFMVYFNTSLGESIRNAFKFVD